MRLTTESSHDRPIGPRGALLQQVLRVTGLRKAELARAVGVDTSTVSNLCLDRWIPGRSACTRKIILDMATVLLSRDAPWAETTAWVVSCGYTPFPKGAWPVDGCTLPGLDPTLRKALLELADRPRSEQREMAARIRSCIPSTRRHPDPTRLEAMGNGK